MTHVRSHVRARGWQRELQAEKGALEAQKGELKAEAEQWREKAEALQSQIAALQERNRVRRYRSAQHQRAYGCALGRPAARRSCTSWTKRRRFSISGKR